MNKNSINILGPLADMLMDGFIWPADGCCYILFIVMILDCLSRNAREENREVENEKKNY